MSRRTAISALALLACSITLLASCGAILLACGSTGAEPFRYPLVATGLAAEPFAVGDWQVTLTRADVAVGPVYLCATAAASPELCAVAIGEFTEVAVVDALDPAAQPLGDIDARPGDVRSAMLDYGISWFTTATAPAPLSALDHSARISGTATLDDISLEFDATIDVTPPMRGSPALVGLHAVTDAPAEDSRLELRIDVRGWLADVDFDALAAIGPSHLIKPGDDAHAAIAFAMTTQPPVFRWTGP
ncbi:MAG TPA: hypothetical protein VGB85_13545 [Nannocystis sp.]